jgi:5-methylcytosine-specific restriction enzyme subunit McrC
MSRRLSLIEWQPCRGVQLDYDEVRSLRRAASWIEITPAETDGEWDLRSASNKVGVVDAGDLSVFIGPAKCPANLVVFMMSYALGATTFQAEAEELSSDGSVWDAMLDAYESQLARALRRGVHRGYRSEEDSLPLVRGQIRMADQLRRQFRLAPPLEVTYDDYTEDIVENRVLKAALRVAHALPVRSPELRRRLRGHEPILANVRHVEIGPRAIPAINWTRLNEHLRPAYNLASMILAGTSISLESGLAPTTSFTVNMADVFERFVVTALRDTLALDEYTFPNGVQGRLALSERIPLVPDFSWWSGDRCIAVGDVKYKKVSAEGVLHPDLYQVLAYSVAAQTPSATLIYAKGEDEPVTHFIEHANKELCVEVLSLDSGSAGVLASIQAIASRFKAHAVESFAA